MKVRGNWYAEEFGGGSKHELMNWKGFCQLAVHVMILHPRQRIAVIQNMVQLYSYLCCEVSCALNRLVSLLPVFGHAALLPL